MKRFKRLAARPAWQPSGSSFDCAAATIPSTPRALRHRPPTRPRRWASAPGSPPRRWARYTPRSGPRHPDLEPVDFQRLKGKGTERIERQGADVHLGRHLDAVARHPRHEPRLGLVASGHGPQHREPGGVAPAAGAAGQHGGRTWATGQRQHVEKALVGLGILGGSCRGPETRDARLRCFWRF